jgi:transposase
VIHLSAGTKIWLAAGVTDMRRGFDGLSAQVQTVLQQQPFSGHVFLFRGRRGDIVKCLWFDGDGLCLFAKRLEKGRFIWPQATEGTVCLSRAQLSMLLEGIDWPKSDSKPRSSRPGRKPLPEDLPREVIMHMPEHDCCLCCGGQLHQFGEDVSEQRERIPATYKVIRHVRPKFACSACERIVEAPAPSRPIAYGLAGPNLLAHVLVSKFADHQPLYRQSEIFAREGIDLDRSTLAGWVGAASELVASLVDEIRKHVLAGSKVYGDDTPVPVLAPGNGRTKTGRLWTYVRDDRPAAQTTAPAVWFAYSEDRKGEHPRRHLKDFSGALQADAYSGLHHLYDDGRIYEVACWAHARRKFHDIHVTHRSPITTEALNRIGALYGIEEQVRGKPPDLRCSVRQAQSKPILDDLRQWMEKMLRSLSAKSDTAGAIRYALAHWRASRAMSMMVCWKSIIAPPRGRSGRSRLDERITCFSVPIPAVSAQLRSTPSLAQPSSADSIPRFTFAPSWRASRTIRSIASLSFCPGTSLPHSNPSPQRPA